MTLEPGHGLGSLVSPAGLRLHDRGVRRPAHPGRPVVQPAFLVGYFDTLEEIQRVYDAHKRIQQSHGHGQWMAAHQVIAALGGTP